MLIIALLVLALPGLLLAVWVDDLVDDPTCVLATAGVGAAATWVTSFWFLRVLDLGLPGLVVAISTGSAVGLLLSAGRVRSRVRSLRLSRANAAVLVAMLGLAALRLVPLLLAPVAPGADMSMHGYMTRLILEAGGIPHSYRPVVPVDEFGAYAAGLPTLAALLSALSGAPAERTGLLVACLAHLALTLALYGLLRVRFAPSAALFAALLATVSVRDPQNHFCWGGNPTVLSLVFCLSGLCLLERLASGPSLARLLALALVFAAAPLTHAVIPLALALLLPPILLLRLLRAGAAERRSMLVGGAGALGLVLLLLAPYLLNVQIPLSDTERAWIFRFQNEPIHLPPGPLWLFPVSLVPYLAVRLGPVLPCCAAAALIARRWFRAGPLVEEALFTLGIALLVLNATVWILPGSYALYPDRITMLLIVPMARVVAEACAALAPRCRTWLTALPRRRRVVAEAALALSVGAGLAVPFAVWYLAGLRDVAVTRDDLAAIRWIAENTPADAVIENNYGDAGLWVPVLAWRAVRIPHVHVVYLDETRAWQNQVQSTYMFVGAKLVYDSVSPRMAQLVSRPERFEEVFRQGRSAVYRIR